MNVYIYIYVCVYKYICTHTHTHLPTYTQIDAYVYSCHIGMLLFWQELHSLTAILPLCSHQIHQDYRALSVGILLQPHCCRVWAQTWGGVYGSPSWFYPPPHFRHLVFQLSLPLSRKLLLRRVSLCPLLDSMGYTGSSLVCRITICLSLSKSFCSGQ